MNILTKKDLGRYLASFLNSKKVILFLLSIFYLLSLSHNVTTPFIGGTNDYNTTLFPGSAINWSKFGPLNLNLSQYLYFDNLENKSLIPYFHHPQFITLPLWLSYKIFGIGEWQTRLVPVFFSFLAFLVFLKIVDLIFKKDFITIGAGFFYVFIPSSIYFGRMMSHEAITNFFILLGFLFLILFEKKFHNFYLFGLLGSVFVGGLMDWPMFYAALSFFLYVYLSKDYPNRRLVFLLILLASLSSLCVTFWQFNIGGALGFLNLFQGFLRHSFLESTSLASLIVNKIYHESVNFTVIALFLSLLGILYFWRKSEFKEHRLMVLVLALPAIIHYGLFMGGKSHEFWSFYFIPFVSLMTLFGVMFVMSKYSRLAIILLIYFVISSLWNTYMIFYPRFVFVNEDINFIESVVDLSRKNVTCFDLENDFGLYLHFYFMRSDFAMVEHLMPCGNSRYFLLRDWDTQIKSTDWHNYGILNNGFRNSIETAGFEVGSLIQILKNVPIFKNKLESKFANWQPVYNEWSIKKSTNEDFVKSLKLNLVSCSPNLCLYEK